MGFKSRASASRSSAAPDVDTVEVPAAARAAHHAALLELRRFGLGYPEAHFKSPWPDHMDLAVRDKTFAYLNKEGVPLSVSCKLPVASALALELPFTQPTGYGLGRSGWVTASFAWHDELPVELLQQWIDESYRAQAPTSLVRALAR